VVIAVLFVAGDIGNNLRTKSAATKAADATSSWSPSSKKFCTSIVSLGTTLSKQPVESARALSSMEALSISSPTSALHAEFSLLAQGYANLLNDPKGLSAVNTSAFAPTEIGTLEKSTDQKVVTFAKINKALDNQPYTKPLVKAESKCSSAKGIVSGDQRQADDATAVAIVDDAYYNDVAANGAFPITAAAVSADISSGTTATVTSGHTASGAPDFSFAFANGPTVCVSSPQTANAASPALVTC
jgi:hypothetical protein